MLAVAAAAVEVGFTDRDRGTIPFEEMTWARPWVKNQRGVKKAKRPAQVVAVGDVVAVERLGDGSGSRYGLRQIPDIAGAITREIFKNFSRRSARRGS